MAQFLKNITGVQLFSKCLKQSMEMVAVPNRTRIQNPKPRKRHPEWLPRPTRVLYDQKLTSENEEFLREVVESKYGPLNTKLLVNRSPLKIEPIQPQTEWTPKSQRTGLIARKIGVYPMWLKNGTKVRTTLLQIPDNQVIKYIPPEEFAPVVHLPVPIKRKLGCLIVGAETADPQLLTKEYCGIFNSVGVPPKRLIGRFMITPDAALQSGTPLLATHFKPGERVDIRGKTVDRGFQGVMKRWGFKGMPASHGVTKTHRRPGNIGSGGARARVVPGTKLPGHMGNRWRIIKAARILRVNTKYNIIWVMAPNVPGEINNMCYIYDTILPRRRNISPHFPTYFTSMSDEPLPENLYADDVHQFDSPTIEYTPES